MTDRGRARRGRRQVDATIGLDRLRALHVNDSATPLGSNRDRHADVLEGQMGKGMGVFLAHPAFEQLAAYLETPGKDGHGVARPTSRVFAACGRARSRSSAGVSSDVSGPGGPARMESLKACKPRRAAVGRPGSVPACPRQSALGVVALDREQRRLRVVVDVRIDAAEDVRLEAPAAAGAQHDQVVVALLELLDDLLADVPRPLDVVDDDLVRRRVDRLARDPFRPARDVVLELARADAAERRRTASPGARRSRS